MVYMINKNERIKMYYFEDYHLSNMNARKITKQRANLNLKDMLEFVYKRAPFITILGGINDIEIRYN